MKRLFISIKLNGICNIDKTQLFLYTDSVENKESRLTLIWMPLNDERQKKYTLYYLDFLSHNFSWGSFGLRVYQSICSSKLNLPLVFLLAECKYLPPRTVSLSQTNLSVKLNSDTLICRADRQQTVVSRFHVPSFDFYERDMCFALVVISKTVFLSFVYGNTMNSISSFLQLM